jgi:hypothetical protein
VNLTANQLHTLRHMLGINTPDDKVPKPYRNYAAVNPGDPEYVLLAELGAVEIYSARGPSAYHYYRCTDAGQVAAMASHRTIRKTKASRVYSTFLRIHDCLPDLTFKSFLTDPKFSVTRREA